MKKFIILLLAINLFAGTLGGGNAPLSERQKEIKAVIYDFFELKADTKSGLVMNMLALLDENTEWYISWLNSPNIYEPEDLKKQNSKFISFFILRDGRIFNYVYIFDTKTKDLILNTTESITLKTDVATKDKDMESKKVGWSIDVKEDGYAHLRAQEYLSKIGYIVNSETNTIMKSFFDIYHETLK